MKPSRRTATPGRASKPPSAERPRIEAAMIGTDFVAYLHDVGQWSVLFWDTLRQRANNMLEHERAGLPPLLDFKYETLLDARRFDHPANYALLRITEIGNTHAEDCVDPDKPPVIVVDPRAGHGPGIGGFKRDSEVGMALNEGHPVYFVIFSRNPPRDRPWPMSSMRCVVSSRWSRPAILERGLSSMETARPAGP